ncbi:hypothetical protein M422DRAFT_253514 [Sphaerobolus stellatus SS14]|uniref:Uncharacterized protein n=1 Tax=Sphaerobolus stellatus (strain SS14) TaxID=990650 RepID=A0A0C9VN10_SPHS4|nr:hypothetical protein M422DRAFT_253514 [Sphaerobolus stellatus SS14]
MDTFASSNALLSELIKGFKLIKDKEISPEDMRERIRDQLIDSLVSIINFVNRGRNTLARAEYNEWEDIPFAPTVIAAEKATQDPKPTKSLAETTNDDISKPKRKAETAKESGNDEMIVVSNGQGKKKKGKEEEVVSGKAAEQKAEVAEGRVDEEQPRKPARKGKPQPTVRVAFKCYVTVSKVPLPFNGVLQLWHTNYYHRERLLDWEERPVGVWESSCMSSARFIEANELEQSLKLGAVLDLTPSFDDYEGKEAALFSEVVDAFKTLPLLDQFPGIKNVDGFLNSIQRRVCQGLDAIISYPTDKGLTRMKIGGPCGLSAILRMTEFYRHSVTAMRKVNETSEDMGERLQPVEALLDRMEIVLAKEQWRRWASASFAIGAVPRVDRVRCVWYVWMEAIMSAPTEMEKWWDAQWPAKNRPELIETFAERAWQRARGFQPDDMLAELPKHAWQCGAEPCRVWLESLTPDLFKKGCIVEFSLCMLCVYMLGGICGQATEQWWLQVTARILSWMHELINKLSPHLWDKQTVILSAFKSPWDTLEPAQEEDAAQSSQATKNISATTSKVDSFPSVQGETINRGDLSAAIKTCLSVAIKFPPLPTEDSSANGVSTAKADMLSLVTVKEAAEQASTSKTRQVMSANADAGHVSAADSIVPVKDVIVTAGRLGGKKNAKTGGGESGGIGGDEVHPKEATKPPAKRGRKVKWKPGIDAAASRDTGSCCGLRERASYTTQKDGGNSGIGFRGGGKGKED